MKFYIGSGLKNSEQVSYYAEVLKKNGWEHTYNWVGKKSDDISLDDIVKYAQLESQAIIDSDVVIILQPAGRGTHIELGMALALKKKIFLCGDKEGFDIKNTVAFYELPSVIQLTGTRDENLKRIMEDKNNE